MSLPFTFTLIRHGLSEANIVQKGLKDSTLTALPEAFFDRHDSNMRLAAEGVLQAQAAGDWLRANAITFDRHFVSPHTRTRETAYNLRINGEWRVDDRFRERDYGEIHSVTPDLRSPLSPESQKSRDMNKWYWTPLGGESLASGVRSRVDAVMNSLYRREGVNHAVAVSHGEFISTARFVIERMTPDRWLKIDKNPSFKVQNCMIVQYSRVNPNDPNDINSHYNWVRGICPWDESLSWNDGEWFRTGIIKHSDADLEASVLEFAPIF